MDEDELLEELVPKLPMTCARTGLRCIEVVGVAKLPVGVVTGILVIPVNGVTLDDTWTLLDLTGDNCRAEEVELEVEQEVELDVDGKRDDFIDCNIILFCIILLMLSCTCERCGRFDCKNANNCRSVLLRGILLGTWSPLDVGVVVKLV